MKSARTSSISVSPMADAFRAPSAPRGPNQESARPAQSEKPDHRAISERARVLWRERGCPMGRDEEIWLAAERELSGVGAAAGLGRKDAA